jgi:hypothetical protein
MLWLFVTGNPEKIRKGVRAWRRLTTAQLGKRKALASFVEHYVTPWMLELPTFLYLWAATSPIISPLTAENIYCLKHNDIWRL